MQSPQARNGKLFLNLLNAKGKSQDSGKYLTEQNEAFCTTLWCVGVFFIIDY